MRVLSSIARGRSIRPGLLVFAAVCWGAIVALFTASAWIAEWANSPWVDSHYAQQMLLVSYVVAVPLGAIFGAVSMALTLAVWYLIGLRRSPGRTLRASLASATAFLVSMTLVLTLFIGLLAERWWLAWIPLAGALVAAFVWDGGSVSVVGSTQADLRRRSSGEAEESG